MNEHLIGHRQRMREKLLSSGRQGKNELIPDYEILEMILFSAKVRGDTKQQAKALLKRFGSFACVIYASDEELSATTGIGESGIFAMRLASEAARRILRSKLNKKPILQSWQEIIDYCKLTCGYQAREQFRTLFLDSKNHLMFDELQSEGTTNNTAVYPREIVSRALSVGASGIILVHNHPSGNTSPSNADLEMTARISAAFDLISIKLVDHIIIGADSHYSFRNQGVL